MLKHNNQNIVQVYKFYLNLTKTNNVKYEQGLLTFFIIKAKLK